jgi:hypothetical protein
MFFQTLFANSLGIFPTLLYVYVLPGSMVRFRWLCRVFLNDMPRKSIPHGSSFILVSWMRIRIRFGRTDPDLDPGGQKGPSKIEKKEIFKF